MSEAKKNIFFNDWTVFNHINSPLKSWNRKIFQYSWRSHFIFCLVVWLPWILFSHINWVSNHPNWRTHIFQRGGPTTNQFWIVRSPRFWCKPSLKMLTNEVQRPGGCPGGGNFLLRHQCDLSGWPPRNQRNSNLGRSWVRDFSGSFFGSKRHGS